MKTVIPEIISQYAEEAAFRWQLRNDSVCSPLHTLEDLALLDEKIEANLDGLCIAGEVGWDICKEALEQGNAGEYFAASIAAFKSGDESNIQTVLEKGSADEKLSRGIISALGWLPYEKAAPFIQQFLESPLPGQKHIGIAASAIHRVNPGQFLSDALEEADPILRTRSLKATGELGRSDLLSLVESNLDHDDENCRFYAAWSACLLGNRNALSVLQSFALSPSFYQEAAVKMAFRSTDLHAAMKWHRELAANRETARQAVIGSGIIGDPALIPWLIEQMDVPASARVAGEAFTLITGADITNEMLEGELPEGLEAGPNDDPEDDNVQMDADEGLPWPNPELIRAWWETNKSRFNNGARHLLGLPITPENIRQILKTGFQHQRYAAAVEQALLQPGKPLLEVRAPGHRQLRA